MTLWINSHISKYNTSFPFEMRSNVGLKFSSIVDRKSVFWNMIYKNLLRRRNVFNISEPEERKVFHITHRMWHRVRWNACMVLRSRHVDWIYLFMKASLVRELIWIWILIRNIEFHFGLAKSRTWRLLDVLSS